MVSTVSDTHHQRSGDSCLPWRCAQDAFIRLLSVGPIRYLLTAVR